LNYTRDGGATAVAPDRDFSVMGSRSNLEE